MRRRALLKSYYPSIVCKDIRGNVETRIQKCDDGQVDGVLLSTAGLMRLNLIPRIAQLLEPSYFFPAPGQGVIVIQMRYDNFDYKSLIESINNPNQALISSFEMKILQHAELDCGFPLGMWTQHSNQQLKTKIFVGNSDFTNTTILDYSIRCEEIDDQVVFIAWQIREWLNKN